MTTLVIIHDIFVADVGFEQYYNIEFQTISTNRGTVTEKSYFKPSN